MKTKRELKPQEIKNPLTACLLNFVMLGFGFVYLGKKVKGLFFFLAGGLLAVIGGYIGIIIAYIVTLIVCFYDANKLNEGKNSSIGFKKELVVYACIIMILLIVVVYLDFSKPDYKCGSVCKKIEGYSWYDFDSGENKCICYDKDDKILKEIYL